MKKSLPYGEHYFSREKSFYSTVISMFVILMLQNLITYSVNVADNLMLGVYDQTALSGAAAVNQIQFILQQITLAGLGEGLVVMSTQYWGKRDAATIEKLIGCALCCVFAAGGMLTIAAFAVPQLLVGLFTDDALIKEQSLIYISTMRYTYIPFMITSVLLCSLRSVQIVSIAFRLSVTSLIVNVVINWLLIFGNLGAPEMGIQGAAIGTLTARYLELIIMLVYCRKKKLPIKYKLSKLFSFDISLMKRYIKVMLPCVISSGLFSSSIALQTAVMGHLSADAIAANSVSSTVYQYCKMIPSAAAASTSVWIGKTIGKGDLSHLREYTRSFQWMFAALGIMVGTALLGFGNFILGFYELTPRAGQYAHQMILVLAFVLAASAAQSPCLTGIIRGGGDTKYVMYNDIIYVFLVVILSLTAAFVWKWPVWAVVLCMNIDQFCKIVSVVLVKTNSYTWIKRLAK